MFRSSFTVLLLAFSTAVSAQGFDYDYLQLDYANVEFDDINVDGDGFGVSGSFAINPDWHVFAGYQGVGLDFGIDATTIGLGIGYNTELTPLVDAYARLSFQNIELDAPAASGIDDNGLGFGVGLRYRASRELELNAGIDYVDFDDFGDDTAFSAGALYSFDQAFAVGLSGSWSDDVSSFVLSGRYYFGK